MKVSTAAKGLLAASAIAISATTLAATPAHAAGPRWHNCPYGEVCVYPSKTALNAGNWTYHFASYAGHNVSNQYGTKYVVDNQYGAHAAGLCAKSGGKGGFAITAGVVGEGSPSRDHYTWSVNFTPVNSLDLRPLSQYSKLCHR